MMDRQNVVVFDICVGFGPEMLFGNSSVQFFGQARGKNFSEICKQARLEARVDIPAGQIEFATLVGCPRFHSIQR